MASFQSSTAVLSTDEYDPADPFTWNLAQLEHELCDNPQPGWAAVAKREQLPSDVLRKILRDNMVDGQSMMEDLLTADSISKELGIAPFGMKRAMLRVLDFFRSTSRRYTALRQQELETQNAELYGRRMSLLNGGFASPQITNSNFSALRQSPIYGAATPMDRVQQPAFSPLTARSLAAPVHGFTTVARSAEPVPDDAVERLPQVPTEANSFHRDAVAKTVEQEEAPSMLPKPVQGKKRLAPTLVSHVDERRAKVHEEKRVETRRSIRQPSLAESTATDDAEWPEGDFILTPQAAPSTYKEMLARSTKRKLGDMTRGYYQAPGRHGARHPAKRRATSSATPLTPEEGDVDTQYDYLLTKYPAKAEEQDALPLYGESGDENNFDDELLDEMDAEEEERKQDSRHLTQQQIGVAIDKAVEEIKAIWRDKKFVKVQLKGHRIWMKAAKEGHRWLHSQKYQLDIQNLTKRVDKLRKTIVEMKHTWHRTSEVNNQCQCMEESVCQREEYQYYVDILALQKPPDRPDIAAVQQAKKADRISLPEGEEVLESEDDSDLLNDFIYEDTSDVESIPHDAPDAEVDDILQAAQDSKRQQYERLLIKHAPVLPAPSTARKSTTPQLQPATPVQSSTGSQSDTANDADDSDSDPIITPLAKKLRVGRVRAEAPVQSTPLRDVATSVSTMDIDTEDDGYKQESDLDQAALPNTKYRSRGKTVLEAIELSSSPPSVADQTDADTPSGFEVRTPDLNPVDAAKDRKPKLKLKVPSIRTSSDEHTSSPKIKLSQPSDTSDLPNLEDVENMRLIDWNDIDEAGDHRRALAKAVYELDWQQAETLYPYVENIGQSLDKQQDELKNGLITLSSVEAVVQAFMNKKVMLAQTIGLLFLSYVHHTDYVNDAPNSADINEAYTELEARSRGFYACLRIALESYRRFQDTQATRTPVKKRKKARTDEDEENELDDDTSELLVQDSDAQSVQSNEPGSSHKKRKYKVAESQEAKTQQLNDQLRVAENERRRIAVDKKMKDLMAITGDASKQSINFDETRLVYLDPHIGRRVKPHQVNGIQFLWREIIDDNKQRGCLLAHTMGLGKTMQVISLLVTIAQCNQSPDPRIRELIPPKHRKLTVLILCPPSLLDNWHEELILWTPPDNPLGEVRKITGSFKMAERAGQIRAWVDQGGVLLLSYEMFRGLIGKQKAKLAEADGDQLEDDLLNGPNIIVADEAHKMKNVKAKITQVASRFRSLSRIALTGSPLNNHLEEYHAMIDWIAPGYLGNLVQFKAKYSEPINHGLYADSSASERKVSLKKLHVLKRDLDPKICRAGISAVEKDMPSKTEFFITIPLTQLQRKAYTVFVEYLLQKNREVGTSNTKLWDWLAVLSLLCNHPSCFLTKLEERKHKSTSSSQSKHEKPSTDDVGQTLPMDVELAEIGLAREAMDRAIQVYEKEEDNNTLDRPELSNRSLVVSSIIRESMAIGDKVLIFSHSIPTLNYLENMLVQLDCQFSRIDGSTSMSERQQATKLFNHRSNASQVFLISMRAGGLGLNLHGANRVIIYDFGFNPSWEEQAIGRAYRLGQKKPVFVYRFRAGGTFEEVMYNKAVFKTQLFQRVVDKKNPMRHASKKVSDYFFLPRDIVETGYPDCVGKDPKVLDLILGQKHPIVNIELTETFQKEDDDTLTGEDLKEAEEEYADEKLAREDPEAYNRKRKAQIEAHNGNAWPWGSSSTPSHARRGQHHASANQVNPRRHPYPPVPGWHGDANAVFSADHLAWRRKNGLDNPVPTDPAPLSWASIGLPTTTGHSATIYNPTLDDSIPSSTAQPDGIARPNANTDTNNRRVGSAPPPQRPLGQLDGPAEHDHNPHTDNAQSPDVEMIEPDDDHEKQKPRNDRCSNQ